MHSCANHRPFALPTLVCVVAIGMVLAAFPPSLRAETEPGDTLFAATIEQDLASATRAELLDWARILGIDPGGARDELEQRIRDHYGIVRSTAEVGTPESSGEQPDGDRSATPGPTSNADDEPIVARIVDADTTSFFQNTESDEEYVRISGGVELTMQEGNALHRVIAREVVFNLTLNTLSARGDVRYALERPEGVEEFRGEEIVFEIATWEGVFLSGRSESRSNIEGADVDFSITGERITRSGNQVIVVDGGTVTSSRATPPHYRIRAQRIWILAPGEWGLRRAVLYMGRVPVFYVPVFFLPGDRLFFNPAVGTRSRTGAFIQTTTYLFGASEQRDPPISIMQLAEAPDDETRVIRGLFLVVPGEDEVVRPQPPGWSLKIMADIYATLGAYAGVDAILPQFGPFETFEARLGVGGSRTVYRSGTGYTAFFVDEAGISRQYWNTGNLFGRQVPLRFEADLATALREGPWSLSVEALLLSDPQFRRDFGAREEGMDWGFLLGGSEPQEETGSTVTSSRWDATVGWQPQLPEPLTPWINRLSVDTFRGRLNLQSRTNQNQPPENLVAGADAPPEASFFFPETAVLPELGVTLSGSLFSYPPQRARENRAETPAAPPADTEAAPDAEDDRKVRPPWQDTPPETERETSDFRLPALADDLDGVPVAAPGSASLSWTLRPVLRRDLVSDNASWDEPEDVSFSWLYETVQTRTQLELTGAAASPENILRLASSVRAEVRFQELNVEGTLAEATEDALRLEAFRFRGETAAHTSSLVLTPLQSVDALRSSNLEYRLASQLYDRRFTALDDRDQPQYARTWGGWSSDTVSVHESRATLRWRLGGVDQQISAVAVLPPLDRRYLGTAVVRLGPTTHELSAGIRETDGQWKPDPITQRHTIASGDSAYRASQFLQWDTERGILERAETSGRAGPLTVRLTGQYGEGVRFTAQDGWVRDPTERFRWSALQAELALSPEWRLWRRRISIRPVADAVLNADLNRFTASSFQLGWGLEFEIYRFVLLSVTARTRNDLVYQYVPSLAAEVDRPARSLPRDVFNSLRLFNVAAREDTPFKMESIDVSLVHDLEDWNLEMTYSGSPVLEGSGQAARYRWQSLLTILVRWRAISELRRSIEVEDGVLEFVE